MNSHRCETSTQRFGEFWTLSDNYMTSLGVGGVISITMSLPIIHLILYVKIMSIYNGMAEIFKDLPTFCPRLVCL